MKRVFIIHGWNSNPAQGWKPWLKRGLEERGFAVDVPQMPDPVRPKASEWVDKIADCVGKPDDSCFFVGHSLGSTAILRYLETIDAQTGGCVLVAGPSSLPKKYPFIRSFFEKDFNWIRIRSNCRRFVAVHSENDMIIPVKHAYLIKEKLGADMIVGKRGHYTGVEGVKEVPEILEEVVKLSGVKG